MRCCVVNFLQVSEITHPSRHVSLIYSTAFQYCYIHCIQSSKLQKRERDNPTLESVFFQYFVTLPWTFLQHAEKFLEDRGGGGGGGGGVGGGASAFERLKTGYSTVSRIATLAIMSQASAADAALSPILSPLQSSTSRAWLASNSPKVPDVCFVTGGTGFVGQRLVEMLVERGAKKVVSFDIVPPPKDAWQHPNIEWVVGDITKPEQVHACSVFLSPVNYNRIASVMNSSPATLSTAPPFITFQTANPYISRAGPSSHARRAVRVAQRCSRRPLPPTRPVRPHPSH